jgi:hypothetical protein
MPAWISVVCYLTLGSLVTTVITSRHITSLYCFLVTGHRSFAAYFSAFSSLSHTASKYNSYCFVVLVDCGSSCVLCLLTESEPIQIKHFFQWISAQT